MDQEIGAKSIYTIKRNVARYYGWTIIVIGKSTGSPNPAYRGALTRKPVSVPVDESRALGAHASVPCRRRGEPIVNPGQDLESMAERYRRPCSIFQLRPGKTIHLNKVPIIGSQLRTRRTIRTMPGRPALRPEYAFESRRTLTPKLPCRHGKDRGEHRRIELRRRHSTCRSSDPATRLRRLRRDRPRRVLRRGATGARPPDSARSLPWLRVFGCCAPDRCRTLGLSVGSWWVTRIVLFAEIS